LAKHCTINFCQVFDHLERQLPEPALYAVANAQRQAILDTSDQQVRDNFAKQFAERETHLQKLCEQLSAGLLPFDTSEPVMNLLAKAYGKRRSVRKPN
jgi:protein subunit release factor A